jgi:hypothetical protein
MRIGVDFDNTIVCYDGLFHRVALEQKLIPADLPVNKSDVRNHLRQTGREPLWTEMQGYVYGARMSEAAPFPGVIEFFQQCRRAGIQVCIISHKTRHPFLGEKYDLHQAAQRWLEQQGFFDPARIGLARDEVFFELTKEAKLQRIGQTGCNVFIDDLPELLSEPSFPKIDRILFDPANLYAAEKQFIRARSWAEISERFRKAAPEGQFQAEKRFALSHGLTYPVAIEPISGGGNNRVYRVSDNRRQAVLKSYFRHPTDTRDRFAAERAFYEHLWKGGIRRTPEPLAWNADQRFALFAFVEGRKLLPGEVNESAVGQALEFIVELNQDRRNARGIAPASEACQSLTDHISVVDNRVVRLQQIDPSGEIDRQALEFVRESLQPAWLSHRKPLFALGDWASDVRVLSPSDFGFHNALLPADGRFRFFDFEYAGWDDPAKLICDFFCQPQVPVPLEFWDRFASALAAAFDAGDSFAERARLLLPAYQIKWCCIMLNEFARGDRERRDFAQGADTAAQRKIAQLAKARAAFAAIQPTST